MDTMQEQDMRVTVEDIYNSIEMTSERQMTEVYYKVYIIHMHRD
jgi:hypothetical protein